MVTSLDKKRLDSTRRGTLPWPLEWLLLAVATVNLLWLGFDLTYLRLHDYYTRNLPQVTAWYDPIKGIEPHRETEGYLRTVDELKALYGAPSIDRTREAALLKDLRTRSEVIVSGSPFELAGKQGIAERIRNRIRAHLKIESSRRAFEQFWSEANLDTPAKRQAELAFFDRALRPLFLVNYYRHYAEDGDFVDLYWWRFDLWFMAVFAAEYLLRSFVTWRRWPRLGLRGALAENAFDLVNLLPLFNLIPGVNNGWLALGRVFHYGERLQRLGAFPSPIAVLIHRYSGYIADEVTDLVVVKVLAQMEDAVRTADFTQFLPEATRRAPVPTDDPGVALNGFVRDQTGLVVKEVLPQVRPEIEKLVAHSVRRALPLPARLATGLASATVGAAYGAANEAIKPDPEFDRLLQQLVDKLLTVLGTEWREHGTARDMQRLLVVLIAQAREDYIVRNEVSERHEDLDTERI